MWRTVGLLLVAFCGSAASRPLSAPASEDKYLNTAIWGPWDGGGAVQEPFEGHGDLEGNNESLTLRANNRAYLVEDASKHHWSDVKYRKLDLRGKTLSFTVDVARAGCGCNAAIYLVGMDHPEGGASDYCDIQIKPPNGCIEIDLFEGNQKAMQTTLHTQYGTGMGSCNQWGCGVNWGKASNHLFGRGGQAIDSTRPFKVFASFSNSGEMELSLSQNNGTEMPFWNATIGGHNAGASKMVMDDSSAAVSAAMSKGMVLVASLWSAKGDKGMAWLDGGCNSDYPHCDLSASSAVFSDVAVTGPTPPPSPPTPPPPPPPPSPPKPPPSGCPGGTLQKCIGMCPASPPSAFQQCVQECTLDCHGNDIAASEVVESV